MAKRRVIGGLVAAALVGLGSPSQAASSKCLLVKLAELPVTMRGFKPTVTLSINGQDAVFVVDTGGFYSMVSTKAAAKYGLIPAGTPPNIYLQGMGGGQAAAKLASAKTFVFAGVTHKNTEFLVGERVGDEEIVGLLGRNVLGLVDVEYDFANGVMRLFSSKGCGSDAILAYWSNGEGLSRLPLINYEAYYSQLQVAAKINGRPIRVEVDSGAAVSFLSLSAAARVGVRPTSDEVVAGGISFGLFGKGIETSIAPFDSFAIGSEEIRRTRLRIADIDIPNAEMLLGADFFLSHRVLISVR